MEEYDTLDGKSNLLDSDRKGLMLTDLEITESNLTFYSDKRRTIYDQDAE